MSVNVERQDRDELTDFSIKWMREAALRRNWATENAGETFDEWRTKWMRSADATR